MSEGAVGLLVLLGVGVASAVLWHSLVKNYGWASVGATLTAVVAFQVLDYLHRGGRMDMFFPVFFPIVIMVTTALYFGLSLLIGWPFLLRRTRQERDRFRNGHGNQQTSAPSPEVERRWLGAFRIAAVVCFLLSAGAVSSFFPPPSFANSIVLLFLLVPYVVILWGLRGYPNLLILALTGAMGWGMGLIYAVIGVLSGSVLFLALAAHVALAVTAMKVRQPEPPADSLG